MLETLRSICALPDALGRHACEECRHPEMRLLPDGTYHCPACGSEVLSVDATWSLSNPDEHGKAYWVGWIDGRFGDRGSFVDNLNVASWDDSSERLDYYRGHRAGSEARRISNIQNPDACERLFRWGVMRWTVWAIRERRSPMNGR
jgi:hypothetical protein